MTQGSPPVSSERLEAWRRQANGFFAASAYPWAMGLLAMFAGPLVRYAPGPCQPLSICGPYGLRAVMAMSTVWRSIPDIDIDHTFTPQDPPLLICRTLDQRDRTKVVEFVQRITGTDHRSLVLLASKIQLRQGDTRKGLINKLMMSGAPTALRHDLNAMVAAKGLPGDLYANYLDLPEIGEWARQAVPQLAEEFAAFPQCRRERANLCAAIQVASILTEKMGLLLVTPHIIKMHLLARMRYGFPNRPGRPRLIAIS